VRTKGDGVVMEKKGDGANKGLNLGVSFFICLGNLWDSSVYKFILSRNEYGFSFAIFFLSLHKLRKKQVE
jgi:hypothetical protein